MSGSDRELGFTGMIITGMDPQQAWDKIHEQAQYPEVQAIITELGKSTEGRAALEDSRARWAAHGFPPPWNPDPKAE
jgi:hypothetical protein